MELQYIDITQLKPSSLNVRKVGGKAVADLIPSIRSLGVIQPLLVRPEGEGFAVVAGQRRYHACRAIAAEQEEEKRDAPTVLPCLVMAAGDDAVALEASLTENIARLPMDEVDQYRAFAALGKQGLDAAEIAARFGVTARLVRQRLALAHLHGPLLTAYRRGDIRAADIRALTMATKTQQKDWLALFKSEDDYAPTGRALKHWLFGGADIRTEAALFDPADYEGAIITDLFGEDHYFDDAPLFWKHQNVAIAAMDARYRAAGWEEVIILDMGERFYAWEHVETPKEAGGKVYIAPAHNGEVTVHEGFLSHKDARAKAVDAVGESAQSQPPRPELTKSMQRYLGLHRHAAVRLALLDHPQIALRLIAAHMLCGSALWQVRPEPQQAGRDDIAASLAKSQAQQRFTKAHSRIATLLALEEEQAADRATAQEEPQTLIAAHPPFEDETALAQAFARLLTLDDAAVQQILTYLMAETLAAQTGLVEILAGLMAVDPGAAWEPDETFFTLLRDKRVINTMLAEVAGEDTGRAHLTGTAKGQKQIIRDCLSGKRPAQTQNWRPSYMATTMTAYTEAHGLTAIQRRDALAPLFEDLIPSETAVYTADHATETA